MFLRSRPGRSNADLSRRSRSFAARQPREEFSGSRQGLKDVAFFRRMSAMGRRVQPLCPFNGLGVGYHARPWSRPPAVKFVAIATISRSDGPNRFDSPILSVHVVRRRTSRTRSACTHRLSRARGTASATGRLWENSRLATNRTRHISKHAAKIKQPSPREEKKYRRHSKARESREGMKREGRRVILLHAQLVLDPAKEAPTLLLALSTTSRRSRRRGLGSLVLGRGLVAQSIHEGSAPVGGAV